MLLALSLIVFAGFLPARRAIQAEELLTTATVEVATDLLPAGAQDLAHRYQPTLFVLSQADKDRPAAADPLTPCVKLLRAGSYPLLVSPTDPAEHMPRRSLLAADREPFALAAEADALRPLLARARPGQLDASATQASPRNTHS